MKTRIIFVILTLVSFFVLNAESVFAETIGNQVDNFKWWKYCQNPLPDNIHYTVWHNFALVLWGGIIVLGIIFLISNALVLRRARLDESNTQINLFLLFIIIFVTIISGYSGFTRFGTEPIEFFYNAIRPQLGENPLTILWTGIYAPLVRLLPASEIIFYIPARLFAILNIALVYQLSLILFSNSRQSLIAAFIFAMSLSNLRFFATDIPIQQACNLFLLSITAITMEVKIASRFTPISRTIFTILAVMLLPALAIPLGIAGGLFILSDYPKSKKSNRIFIHFAAIAAGILLFYNIYKMYRMPFALHTLPDIANMSVLFASLCIFGLYVALKDKGYAPFIFGASALSTLFVLPTTTQMFIQGGAWLLLAIAVLAPVAASGIYTAAKWTQNKGALVIVLFLVLLILPDYFLKEKDISNYEIERYEFLRDSLELIGEEYSVLYRDNNKTHILSPFPDFIPGYKQSPCLRPREAVATDPESHGQRWIYFGPECALEKHTEPPEADSCETYKLIYNTTDCMKKTIALPDNSGQKVAEEQHEFCKISARKN